MEIVEERMARMCWNDNGWQRPSGMSGKSTSDRSHERRNGYGHEEWLFDLDKLIDGYHYGFLQPLQRESKSTDATHYNITLYTYNSDVRQWYWIGRINHLESIDVDQASQVAEIYASNGWLDQMYQDIRNVEGNSQEFEANPAAIANCRFRPEQAELYEGFPVPFVEGDERPGDYYQFYRLPENFVAPQPQQVVFAPNRPVEIEGADGAIRTTSRTFESQIKEYEDYHSAIQNAFHAYLNDKYPNRTQREAPTGVGSSRIDLKFQDTDGRFIYYEVKSYNSLMQSIRAALGQLMEYAYYPDKTEAKELVIVSFERADAEVEAYINHLSRTFSLPIGYIQFSYSTMEILQAINCTHV